MRPSAWLREQLLGWALAAAALGYGVPSAMAAAALKAADRMPVLSSYRVVADDATMRSIAQRFEVEEKSRKGWEVIVPAARASELLALAPEAHLVSADISEEVRTELSQKAFSGYHNLDAVVAQLKQLAAQHPDIVKLEPIGQTDRGLPILGVKIAQNAALDDESKPGVLITGATHGDEITTTEVVLALIEKLVDGYGKDQRLTTMINTHNLFMLPVLNADGFATGQRYAGNGVDPNREYPNPEDPDRSSVDCIAAMIKFFQAHNIKGSIDNHSYGRLIMYPWAWTTDSIGDDEAMYQDLTGRMAATNDYQPGQISRILYSAPGSSADYFYWKKKTVGLGIEIGTEKIPPYSEVSELINENTESTWLFIESIK